MSTHREDGGPPLELTADLARWVQAGLIDATQAEGIAAHEASRRAAVLPDDRVRVSAPWSERIPGPVVIGYLGAALAVVAVLFLAATYGDRLDNWWGVSLLAAVSVALGVAGGWLVTDRRAAFSRLGDFAWLLSVVAAAAAVGVLAGAVLEIPSEWVPLVSSGSALLVAVGYALAHPHAAGRDSVLVQLAVYGSLFAVAVSALGLLENSPDLIVTPVAHGVTLWALGAVWILLGGGGVVRPGWAAVAVGTATMYLGASMTASESAWWLLLGVASTTAVFAVSLVLNNLLLTVLGVLGVFLFVPQVLNAWLGEEAAPVIPLVLLGLGLALLVVAVVRGRGVRHVGP